MSLSRRILRFPLTRMAIWVAVTAGFFFVSNWLFPRSDYSYWIMATGGALALLFVGVVIEGRSVAETGFGLRGALPGLAGGFGLAGLLMGATIGVMALFDWYNVTAFTGAWARVGWVLVHFFFVALIEEVAMRGLFFRVLEESLGTWIALGFNALLFGLLHLGNPHASLIATLAIAVEAGLLLSAAFMLTRSLWLAIGLHWGWNWVQGSLFGAPVSGGVGWSLFKAKIAGPAWATGGGFGPEAGLICLVICTAAGVWMLQRALRVQPAVRPFWARREGIARHG